MSNVSLTTEKEEEKEYPRTIDNLMHLI